MSVVTNLKQQTSLLETALPDGTELKGSIESAADLMAAEILEFVLHKGSVEGADSSNSAIAALNYEAENIEATSDVSNKIDAFECAGSLLDFNKVRNSIQLAAAALSAPNAPRGDRSTKELEFDQMIKAIETTAVTLREFKNQVFTSKNEAEKTVEKLRNSLSEERNKNSDLASELEALKKRNAEIENDSLLQNQKHERNMVALNNKLKQMRSNLKEARDWILRIENVASNDFVNSEKANQSDCSPH